MVCDCLISQLFWPYDHSIMTHLVPVLAIYTKFDDLVIQVYNDNLDDEEIRQCAITCLEDKFEKPLRKCRFPPKAHLHLEGMFVACVDTLSLMFWTDLQNDAGSHQQQVKELTQKTAESLDNLAIKMLFVSVQQNNLELSIVSAVT